MAQKVTKNDFQSVVLDSSNITLVDFFAPWCGPCQALGPILEELSEELPEGTNVVKVDVDESPELAGDYGVVSIPSIKIFKGGEIVQEFMGVQNKETLKEALESHK